MANRRPAIAGPSGALVFTPSESADTVTPFTSGIIKLPCSTGTRMIIFTLDGSDNLTVTEVDAKGNTVGAGIIVSAVAVTVGTQLQFRMPPTNLGIKAQLPGVGATQVSPQHGNNGTDVFTFVNGNTGTNTGIGGSANASVNPDRTFGGTSLEVGEGIGGQAQ